MSCCEYYHNGGNHLGLFEILHPDSNYVKVNALIPPSELPVGVELTEVGDSVIMKCIPELILDARNTYLLTSDIEKRPIYVVNARWWNIEGTTDAHLIYREGLADVYKIRFRLEYDIENKEMKCVEISRDAFPMCSMQSFSSYSTSNAIHSLIKAGAIDSLHEQYKLRQLIAMQISDALRKSENKSKRQTLQFHVSRQVVHSLFTWPSMRNTWKGMRTSRYNPESYQIVVDMYSSVRVQRKELLLSIPHVKYLSTYLGKNFNFLPVVPRNFVGRDFSNHQIVRISCSTEKPIKFSFDCSTDTLSISFCVEKVVCHSPIYANTEMDEVVEGDDFHMNAENDTQVDTSFDHMHVQDTPQLANPTSSREFHQWRQYEGQCYKQNDNVFTVAFVEEKARKRNRKANDCQYSFHLAYWKLGCCWYDEPLLLDDVKRQTEKTRGFCHVYTQDAFTKLLAESRLLTEVEALQEVEKKCNTSVVERTIAHKGASANTVRTAAIKKRRTEPPTSVGIDKIREVVTNTLNETEFDSALANAIMRSMEAEANKLPTKIDFVARIASLLDYPCYTEPIIVEAFQELSCSKEVIEKCARCRRSSADFTTAVSSLFVGWFLATNNLSL